MDEKENLNEMFELDIRVSSPSNENDFSDCMRTITDATTTVGCGSLLVPENS